MRKTWVKKENIYYKPFYKQKLKMGLLSVFMMAIIFFAYQVFSINQLQLTSSQHTKATTHSIQSILSTKTLFKTENKSTVQFLRGIRLKEAAFYKPNKSGMFTCIKSGLVIPYDRVNDDFCDCIDDGSDEPSTNACARGIFYCTQLNNNKEISIPSSRINDGICDCCDGSDEWLKSINDKIKICPNICV